MSDTATIFEVGPRDGLQNEPGEIATSDKITLVNALADAGLRKIEVSSFVSPKWIPQMADAAKVFKGIKRKNSTKYAALVPNLHGCEAAIKANADEIAVFASASESFSQKNINCSVAESMARFVPVIELASCHSLPVRGYISCVTDCPYEGSIAPEAVAAIAENLLKIGCYDISLGDTIGRRTPKTVSAMLDAVLICTTPTHLAGHFHDTGGLALENILVCLERDLRVFDAAVGSLGGCPYAPGAPGNVASEKVITMLHSKGIKTGVDLSKLNTIANELFCKRDKKLLSS